MSAHEFMNMARVRAEQAEARAAKAEAALAAVWDYCEATVQMREGDPHGPSVGTVIASEDVLVILRRHGFGVRA